MTGASCLSRRWVVSLPASKVHPLAQPQVLQASTELPSREHKWEQCHAGHFGEGGGTALMLTGLLGLRLEPKLVLMLSWVSVIYGGKAVLEKTRRRRKRQSVASEKHCRHCRRCVLRDLAVSETQRASRLPTSARST